MRKFKNLIEKVKIIISWNNKLTKINGIDLFKKRQEIIQAYLSANKRKDTTQEDYFKGQADLMEWIVGDKIINV